MTWTTATAFNPSRPERRTSLSGSCVSGRQGVFTPRPKSLALDGWDLLGHVWRMNHQCLRLRTSRCVNLTWPLDLWVVGMMAQIGIPKLMNLCSSLFWKSEITAPESFGRGGLLDDELVPVDLRSATPFWLSWLGFWVRRECECFHLRTTRRRMARERLGVEQGIFVLRWSRKKGCKMVRKNVKEMVRKNEMKRMFTAGGKQRCPVVRL